MSPAEDQAKADARAIQRVLSGDSGAFDHLVKSHYPLVYAISLARLGRAEAAEDLTQEVFLRAFLNLAKLHRPEAFPSWVARMARNLGSNWSRSKRRSSRLLPMVELEEEALENIPEETDSPREAAGAGQEAELLKEAIFALSPDEREMVLLHYMEGCSKKDIADRLRVHPSTVGRTLDRSLLRLKSELEPVLREATQPMRARPVLAQRTMRVVAAAALMTGVSRSALAQAAATGIPSAASGSSTAAQATAFGSLVKALIAFFTTGGPAAIAAKGSAAALAAGALGAGGYHVYREAAEPAFPAESAALVARSAEFESITIPTLYQGVSGWRVRSINQTYQNNTWVESGAAMTMRAEVVEARQDTGARLRITIEDLEMPAGDPKEGLIPMLEGFQYTAICGPAGGTDTMESDAPITPEMGEYIGQAMRQSDMTRILARAEWTRGEELVTDDRVEIPGYDGAFMNIHSVTQYEGLTLVDGQEKLVIRSTFSGDVDGGFRVADVVNQGQRTEIFLDFDFSGSSAYYIDPETKTLEMATHQTHSRNIATRMLIHAPGQAPQEQAMRPIPDERRREMMVITYLPE
ncbi:MAG: sigma-70 family RNA polymerase sigma factor [Sumerlaeia bacterium]